MNEIERKKRYRQHRLRIKNATSLVDSHGPVQKPNQQHRELSYIEMMGALYQNGNKRIFTQSPVRQTNSSMHNNIIKTKLSGNSLNMPLYGKDNPDKKFCYAIPYHVWQRYNHLPFVKSPQILGKLLRPVIFLDLQLGNGQPLGRLVVQLFTEACPEIVLQFVRICLARHQDRFNFTRLFVPLWLEGELHLDDKNALTIPNIEHDPTAINHGSAAGILSFPSRYLRGSKFRFISFTISFKPIDVLNGKRIAFGKIRRGQHVLDTLQNFEVTCNGKPVQDVVVTSCGVL